MDFVLQKGNKTIGIEVKSGRNKLSTGISAFSRRFNPTKILLTGRSGVSLGSLKRFENQHEISLNHLLMLSVTLDSTEDFHALFSKRLYGSIDEVLHEKELKKRQPLDHGKRKRETNHARLP